MAHFLFRASFGEKAPAGDGDASSWLLYYKWHADGECFIPVFMIPSQRWSDAMSGDFLWLAVGNRVLGGAVITRVEVEESKRAIELWYNADEMLELPEGIVPPVDNGMIPTKVGDEWLGISASRSCNIKGQ